MPSSTGAQEYSVQFSGYAKNLAIRSSSILTAKSFFLDISRLRTRSLINAGNVLHAEIWLDNELLAGSFLDTPEYQLSKRLARPTFFDLDWTVTDGDKYELRQRLFKAFATVYLGQAELTLGRQRIVWGTGFVWNPTDLLNPFNPVAIELEEKEGVDAAYFAVPLGTLSRFEAAHAPGRNGLKSSTALRIGSHSGDYDFSVMGGDFQDDLVLGGDFAGYLGGAGFRGELAYTWKQDDDDFLRATLNADYNLSNDFYVFLEFHFNGQGSTSKDDYDFTDLLSGRVFNLARHYLAASVTKAITPLLGLSFYNILNLDDRSSLVGPALVYSLATNLELAASAYFFLGANDTEYGQLGSSYFAFLQYYY